MSMVLTTSSSPDVVFYVSLFARMVRGRRRTLGLTVARAAELTGITVSEWLALEAAGWIPTEYRTIRTIAETLEVRATELQVASIMSAAAQDQTVQ